MLLLTIADPDPVPLAAPSWLLWFLLILTFLLHLLFMNLVLGGSVLGGITEALGRRGERPHHAALVRWLSRAMPVALAFTVTMGVAPLLFVQVLWGRLFFSSSVLMAWSWLAVVPVLIVAYYGVYLRAFRGEGLGAAGPAVGWISTLLILIIGFVLSNNMTLMLRPDRFREKYLAADGGFHWNLDDPTLLPRFLHLLLGAIAVSGLVVVVLGLLRRRRQPEFSAWSLRYGSLWFAIPTAVNMVIGVWWLLALPRESILRFMGGDGWATAVFAAGVVLALVALVVFLLAAYAPRPEKPATLGAVLLVLLLVAMILNRDQVRRAALEAMGFEPVAWVAPQWGVISIFAVCLVAALGTVAWMVSALARGEAQR